ncbi:MAG TPA: penicillin-binding transpeptidase domain-containing protein [Kofleriaceae bacterium]|jgi:cell division protein FtsI (penicillin-binding protein 3)
MTPGIPHAARMRAYIVGALVTMGLSGVAYRAYALQVDEGDRYRDLADRQHGSSVNIPAPRGDIIDSRNRPLAVSADVDSIWANPREIQDVTDAAERLSKLLGQDAGALEAKLGADKKFVWLDRHVDEKVAAAVRAMKMPGIVVEKEPRRWYPGRSIGGPIIGRADIDNEGTEGLELSMNEMLKGTHGTGKAVRDAHGHKMFADGMAQPESGATVKLTLDRSIQALADDALMDAINLNSAKGGVVVVLDVDTSHVLAMSSWPNYDPNNADPKAGARNRPVTDAFEAGSVMKMFSISAALDAGIITKDSGFDVAAPLVVGGHAIHDAEPEKYLTVSGIVKHSSNIGTGKIALRFGRDRLYAALKSYGFGQKTGIELPGESAGRMRKGDTWRDVELATISFGYGLTVTPLQLASGLAAIARNGLYIPPRIVESVTDADGNVKYTPQVESRQMMKVETAKTMRKMLEAVFERGKDHGTGFAIVVPGFRSAGKTGTAHKYDAAIHRYADHKYLSSFAGYAPAENPRVVVIVQIDEPSGSDHYGGAVAGPVFARIASESLRYLGVPGTTLQCPPKPPNYNPDTDIAPKTCTIPAPKPVKPLPGAVQKPAIPSAPTASPSISAKPAPERAPESPVTSPSAVDQPVIEDDTPPPPVEDPAGPQ